MKEKIKNFLCAVILLAALPYIITMCFNRDQDGNAKDGTFDILQTGSVGKAGESTEAADPEEYLIGILAKEIPMNYEPEALKAQAVIARTNLLAAREKDEKLPEGIGRKELLKMWGEENFAGSYQRLADAVEATEGMVMTCQGTYIYAAFHAVSAGKTRSAMEALRNDKMPWLESRDSSVDIPSENYLKVLFLEKEDFTQQVKAVFADNFKESEHPLEGLEIAARDSAGYVTKVRAGEKTVTGEEFRNALKLNSACLYLKEVEGKIRIVTKGLGHGLGLSQYGANELAKEGMEWQDILGSYFKNIEISD